MILVTKQAIFMIIKKINEKNGRLVNLFSKRLGIVKSKSLIHSHLGIGKNLQY